MATNWCPPSQYPAAPEHAHNCRVPGCTFCNFRQHVGNKNRENQIPCSLLMRMVTGPPIRDDGWLEFDNLSFMNVKDDSEDKAAAEKQLNDEFGINVRDYKLINYWEEPDYDGDDCPRSPTWLEDRQMRARPERCPLCREVMIHQHVPYDERGCFCHVLPGEECMCGHCIYMRNLKHPEQLQEYLAEKKRWMDDRYKKTPSQEALHQKIKERYEQHLFNKYFLKQDDQSPNETINSSSEVLEQTLALEATLNSTLNSLFDPNSSVRLRPLYETLPPRSGYSTVPGENDAQEIDDAVQEQFRRVSLVADEINKRGQSVSGNSGSSSAHTTEVRERVLSERMEGVKKVTSAAKVVGKLKKKMSKQLMSRTLPSTSEDLNSTVIAGPGNALNNSAPTSAANRSHVSFAPNTSLSSSGNQSLYTTALGQSHYVTANETLDEMSILEALEAAHLSLIEQMEASPDLAQAVQDVCQAEQTVRDLSLSGSFDPEIVNQRRRHMANLRKAAVAMNRNPETSHSTNPEFNQTRPGFLRFGAGRKASRSFPRSRLPNEPNFPGPGPEDQIARPVSMNNWLHNASTRSDRSMKSNASVRSNRSANHSVNRSVHNQSTRSHQLNASTNSMNSSFNPAALHAQIRQQLRDVLHNSRQVLNQTLNMSQSGGNTSSLPNSSHVSQSARPTSLNVTSSSSADESIIDPALVQQSHDQSLANASLTQTQPFSRQNPHYQTNSASTPTAGHERYLRFRTYIAQNNPDMTMIEGPTNNTTSQSVTQPTNPSNPTAQSLRQPANPRDNTLNSSAGSAMNRMFQNSRNATMNSTGSSLHQSLLSQNSTLQPSVLSNNSTIQQSLLGDTTLTNLDDISYMGDVPVPRNVSIHSTVGQLRQALEASVIETMYRLTPIENNRDNTLVPAQPGGKCCRGSNKSCSDGSGIVIEINANPTFVNNPGSSNCDGSLLAQIESMIMARQKEFERHIEALCLSKLDAALARNH